VTWRVCDDAESEWEQDYCRKLANTLVGASWKSPNAEALEFVHLRIIGVCPILRQRHERRLCASPRELLFIQSRLFDRAHERHKSINPREATALGTRRSRRVRTGAGGRREIEQGGESEQLQYAPVQDRDPRRRRFCPRWMPDRRYVCSRHLPAELGRRTRCGSDHSAASGHFRAAPAGDYPDRATRHTHPA